MGNVSDIVFCEQADEALAKAAADAAKAKEDTPEDAAADDEDDDDDADYTHDEL